MRVGRAIIIVLGVFAGCGEVVGEEDPTGTVSISPESPRTADDLVATSTGEGTLQWSKNGTVRGDITSERVTAAQTTKGDTWSVALVTDEGVVLANDAVAIGNTEPTAPDARVEGTSDLSTPLRCLLIGTTSDPDNDPITYSVTWQKNGTPYTTATMTTLPGDTVPAADRMPGDDFACTLTASDSTDSQSALAGAEWFSPTGTAAMGTKQMFTVPADVASLFIEAGGAEGGYSDVPGATRGARLGGTFALASGATIEILVGQQPASSLAGGGGTFVIAPGNMPLVIAGGGGSKNAGTIAPAESMGRIVTSGGTINAPRAVNGNGGNVIAGSNSGAGGGFMTDGGGAGGGKAFINGGAGAGAEVLGGFGGGGGRSGLWGQGGGGGYSGGSCGDTFDGANGTWLGCGGGGSINMGTSPTATAGAVAGPGYVFIIW